MKSISKWLVSGVALMLTACGAAEEAPQGGFPPGPVETAEPGLPSMLNARAQMIDGQGREIGSANLLSGPNGLLIRIELITGALSPGWHGLHLHQVGDCSDIGRFTNSGGHIGKIEGGHGLLNPNGPEGGDIPNIWVAADGSAGYEAFTTLTTAADLLDEDRAAIIIHAHEDDHLSQPIGGAGPRVACGVLN